MNLTYFPTDVSIPLGTINTRIAELMANRGEVSIPLGTINT